VLGNETAVDRLVLHPHKGIHQAAQHVAQHLLRDQTALDDAIDGVKQRPADVRPVAVDARRENLPVPIPARRRLAEAFVQVTEQPMAERRVLQRFAEPGADSLRLPTDCQHVK